MNENVRFKGEPAFSILTKEKCTGCFGCENSCKFKAIKMTLSQEGFYFPKIDTERCIKCGKCALNCPVLNFKSHNFGENYVKVYASFSRDDKVRFESSSGGIFTEMAQEIIEAGGIVFGAAWEKDLSVKHLQIKDRKGLSKLRSSKYIQSNLEGIYLEVVKAAETEGKKVLFTGTPCQAAALRTFTNSENLLIVDVLCHGVPSKVVFDEYIKYISNNDEVVSYNFRDKANGWSKYGVKAKMGNGKIYKCITRKDPFFHGFICDLYSNLSCYDCKFASIPRVGDVTIGDFWKAPQEIMDERGVSVVIANNHRGEKFLEKLYSKNKIDLHPRKLSEALKGNPRICNGFLNMRKNREEILKTVKKRGFIYIAENYINKTKRYVLDK